MPLYEYKCKKGHVFDVIQSFSDAPVTKCEICGAKCERVLSAPSIHFKGSGFYNTDYGTKRRAKETADNKAKESSSSSSSDNSSSGSTDGAGAGKSDSAAKSDSSTSPKKSEATSSASSSKD